jgi:cardiolipin synthase (CMP-forming)
VNVPNIISLARLICVPIMIWLVLSGEFTAAFWLFVAAGLSDAVDGFVARRFNSRSHLGALLDPLADKALLVSMYVTLGWAGRLPNWLVILVVFRDVLIIGGFLLATALAQPMRWEPLYVSKLNTALQIALVALVLADLGLSLGDFGLRPLLDRLVAATTIISGSSYVVRWVRTLAGAELHS